MTKKSAVLFLVAAYLAMGSTAAFANKHHNKNSNSTQSSQSTKADMAATLCFKDCDSKRDACDNFGRSGNQDVETLCVNERIDCQKQCDIARAKNK